MISVLILLGLIQIASRYARLPRAVAVSLTVIILCAVALIQVTLPDVHPLREATGGDISAWFMLGAVVIIVWLYRRWLGVLRRKVQSKTAPATASHTFSDTELNRYSRHMLLHEIGGPGQKKLKNAKVLVIGAGGLGSPALMYLAAAGVGTIGVVDDDVVDGSNLQRQIIHKDAAIGSPKVQSAAEALTQLNPFIDIRAYNRRLNADDAAVLCVEYDLILDGTDNFDTRYMVNRFAVQAGKPLISAALTQWEGQISLYHPATSGPCYQCVFPQTPAPGTVPACAEAGVLGPLPGVIGAMMAVEAVKYIVGAGQTLRERLLIYDALYGDTRVVKIRRNNDCAVCGKLM